MFNCMLSSLMQLQARIKDSKQDEFRHFGDKIMLWIRCHRMVDKSFGTPIGSNTSRKTWTSLKKDVHSSRKNWDWLKLRKHLFHHIISITRTVDSFTMYYPNLNIICEPSKKLFNDQTWWKFFKHPVNRPAAAERFWKWVGQVLEKVDDQWW